MGASRVSLSAGARTVARCTVLRVAVVLPGDERYPAESTPCFLCDEAFDDRRPVVFWSGAGGDLFLHGGCAGSFVLRLARDAWEVERDAGDRQFTLMLRQVGWETPPAS